VYDGEDTFQRVLKLVEANPHRGAPEYAMLALGAGDTRWAQDFRRSLLEEAAAMRFTGPAQSVKYIQYEASQRAYYYPRVRAAFPGLFTPAEEEQILNWFAAINRRALTVEWVDWMYALAFSKPPEGPYENQETGAGLLALLEAHNLDDPSLSSRNLDYLSRNLRGWSHRFRVTDDAVVYQPEWMNNAFFQSLFTGAPDMNAVRRSYEWLLAQALPDGSPLQYNHPGFITMADHAYPAAGLLQDERFVWLSARAAEYLEANQGSLAAKPGLEEAAGLDGASPDLGSCLLYGDSGLPNQVGPLAPDKLVFRDGWTADSAYLLLNLRFTGWHRYKAANTLTLFYQSGRLAGDEMSGEAFSWLPSGRSHFRDKRVPRENLNGLSVERSGLSAVLYSLTGIGGPWAQDPPFYAHVEGFETVAGLDSSRTTIEDWHGWNHRRSVYFYHQGPAVIVDSARGPAGSKASLFWHVTGSSAGLQNGRISLRSDPAPAELLLLPVSPGELHAGTGEGSVETLNAVQFRASAGRLDLVSIFLTREWAGAQAQIQPEGEGYRLLIEKGSQKIVLPLSFE
jgi:hypothetical protein